MPAQKAGVNHGNKKISIFLIPEETSKKLGQEIFVVKYHSVGFGRKVAEKNDSVGYEGVRCDREKTGLVQFSSRNRGGFGANGVYDVTPSLLRQE